MGHCVRDIRSPGAERGPNSHPDHCLGTVLLRPRVKADVRADELQDALDLVKGAMARIELLELKVTQLTKKPVKK